MPSTSKLALLLVLLTTVIALPTPQLAGEGEALNSLFSSTDNGIGYGIENAEENTAGLIASATGGKAAPVPAGPGSKRQLDKISNGFQAIGNAAGMGSQTSSTTTALDNIDGAMTEGAAKIGADAGALEESTLINAGKVVPR